MLKGWTKTSYCDPFALYAGTPGQADPFLWLYYDSTDRSIAYTMTNGLEKVKHMLFTKMLHKAFETWWLLS